MNGELYARERRDVFLGDITLALKNRKVGQGRTAASQGHKPFDRTESHFDRTESHLTGVKFY